MLLEEKNVTSDEIAILHYFDGEWHQMTITSIELVDGVYLYTVTSTHMSPFMVAYNVDGVWFPLEGEAAPMSAPTAGPSVIESTSTPTSTPTKAASSPVPIIGIMTALGAAVLFIRRK